MGLLERALWAVKCVCAASLFVLWSGQEASSQVVAQELTEHYITCAERFGVGPNEVSGNPIFEGERLRALPAPVDMQHSIGIALGECLAELTGDRWAYDPERNRFSTGTFYQQALNAQSRVYDELEEDQNRAILEQAAQEEAERIANVWAATIEACVILFYDDRVEALTKPICHQIFLERGLPE